MARKGLSHVPPAHEMIDPLKDTTALIAQVRAGFVPQPFEISVVPIPVDRDAAVRGQGDQGVPVPAIEPALSAEDHPMPETTSAEPAAAPPQESIVTTTPTTPAPEPTRAAPDLDAVRAEAQRAERERLIGIDAAIEAARALVPAERIPPVRAEAIERGWSADQVRRALFDILVAAAPRPSLPARPETGPGQDDPSLLIDAMAEALAARSMPGYQPRGNGRHAEFMGWRPSDTRLSAFGGGGGQQSAGGGGGGIHSAGNGNAGGRPAQIGTYDNHFGGAQGGSTYSDEYSSYTTDPGWSGYGGGGGSWDNRVGGRSVWGGGGGGSSNQPGGASSHGGNGGTGGTNNAAAPGGGGGRAQPGARGEVRVTVLA